MAIVDSTDGPADHQARVEIEQRRQVELAAAADHELRRVADPALVRSDLVPRHRTLDGFVEAVSQADGIGLADVDAFTMLVVRTDNSVYQFELGPASRRSIGRTIRDPVTKVVYVLARV